MVQGIFLGSLSGGRRPLDADKGYGSEARARRTDTDLRPAQFSVGNVVRANTVHHTYPTVKGLIFEVTAGRFDVTAGCYSI